MQDAAVCFYCLRLPDHYLIRVLLHRAVCFVLIELSAMAPADEVASIPWFVEFMRLHNAGLIPGVSPADMLPSRPDISSFFGPKHGSGYIFDNHDSPEYEQYVRELFKRVLQLNWPVGNILPYGFARALVGEASGLEIDWAEFAYKQTHPHQSHSGVPRVLIEFSSLASPLPPLRKIIPPRFPGQVSPIY